MNNEETKFSLCKTIEQVYLMVNETDMPETNISILEII